VSTKKTRSLYYGGVRQAYPELEPGMNSMSRSVIYGNIIFLSSLDGRALMDRWRPASITSNPRWKMRGVQWITW